MSVKAAAPFVTASPAGSSSAGLLGVEVGSAGFVPPPPSVAPPTLPPPLGSVAMAFVNAIVLVAVMPSASVAVITTTTYLVSVFAGTVKLLAVPFTSRPVASKDSAATNVSVMYHA